MRTSSRRTSVAQVASTASGSAVALIRAGSVGSGRWGLRSR
jgi:hypothetical protein